MIREAEERDVNRLVEMGRRFIAESSYKDILGDNPVQMEELVWKLMASKGVLVAEEKGKLTGMIGYVVFPHFISGIKTAGEVFYWVEPEHRGVGLKLLRAVEKRAKESGAVHMQMI